MTVRIYVGYRKGDWFVVLGDYTICLYKKDEKDAERTRQGEIKLRGESDIITKAALMEVFGQQMRLQLKNPKDEVTFDDCGYFASKGDSLMVSKGKSNKKVWVTVDKNSFGFVSLWVTEPRYKEWAGMWVAGKPYAKWEDFGVSLCATAAEKLGIELDAKNPHIYFEYDLEIILTPHASTDIVRAYQ